MPKPRTAKARPARRTAPSLAGADLLSIESLSPAQFASIMDLASKFKARPAAYRDALRGKSVILLFEKPSLRTRISFEVGVAKLGGHAIYMDHAGQRLGQRESVHDYGKNLERWVDCIVPRVFSHEILEELAAASRVPVINALSDRFHPCQALADLFTLRERFGDLRRVRLCFIGDGNNVCHSLMHAACLAGTSITVVTPEGYEPAPDVVHDCRAFAAASGAAFALSHDPEAVRGHDAVYTDVWASMGAPQEEAGRRMNAFAPYQVNAELMARAGRRALFMHCLPAHRGVEVTDEVLDSSRSIVYDQAENRMHAQNALLHLLLAARD